MCYLGKCCRFWTTKWFIVTDDFITYLRSIDAEHIHETMMYDDQYTIRYGKAETRKDYAVIIQNATRALVIEVHSNTLQIIIYISSPKMLSIKECGSMLLKKALINAFGIRRRQNLILHLPHPDRIQSATGLWMVLSSILLFIMLLKMLSMKFLSLIGNSPLFCLFKIR